jgi:hypothetical protein
MLTYCFITYLYLIVAILCIYKLGFLWAVKIPFEKSCNNKRNRRKFSISIYVFSSIYCHFHNKYDVFLHIVSMFIVICFLWYCVVLLVSHATFNSIPVSRMSAKGLFSNLFTVTYQCKTSQYMTLCKIAHTFLDFVGCKL